MFVRIKTTPNSPRKSVQIVQSFRTGDVVRQKIIRHVGIALDEKELEQLTMLAESIREKLEAGEQQLLFAPEKLAALKKAGKKFVPADENYTVNLKNLEEEQRLISGIHDIYGCLYDELGFEKIFPSSMRSVSAQGIFKNIVLARITNPLSKRASVDMLEENFGISLDLHKVYRMMDALDTTAIERLNARVYEATAGLFQNKIDVVFFDATTVYFEAFEEDELRRMGYSKDLMFNQPQVLLSLLVTREGLPLGYRVFDGSVYEGHTVLAALKDIQAKTGAVGRAVFVADAGMLSKDNLKLLEDNGFEYIVGARLKNMGDEIKRKVLDHGGYCALTDGGRVTRIKLEDGKNLVVSYDEGRAKRDRHNREKAVARIKKKLEKNAGQKGFISQSGCRKYLKISGEPVLLDEEKVKADAAWDGLHGVITNAAGLDDMAVLEQYRNLWVVEEAFRITKHDLKVRPVFHWTPARVRAHFAISFSAFALVKHMEYRVRLQYERLSPERIRQILVKVQATILFDTQRKIRYVLPSRISQEARKIYQIFRQERRLTPHLIKRD